MINFKKEVRNKISDIAEKCVGEVFENELKSKLFE